MEKRLDATLGAVKTVGPALVKFYNSLSDEQKARFNSLLRSASRPPGEEPSCTVLCKARYEARQRAGIAEEDGIAPAISRL
jgi:hypothetical protein